jgi:hypothetical protein
MKWNIVIPKIPELLEEDGSTILIRGNATYSEALDKVETMNKAGWFNSSQTYSFDIEILTYNQNLKSGGFYRFKHSLNSHTGIFQSFEGSFQTIYPTSYDE